MLTAASGLSSNNQIITHDQNRTGAKLIANQKPEIPDLSFQSKGELKKLIESLCWEIAKLKENSAPSMVIQERDYYREKYRALQIKYASLQTDCINRFKEINEVELRIAG